MFNLFKKKDNSTPPTESKTNVLATPAINANLSTNTSDSIIYVMPRNLNKLADVQLGKKVTPATTKKNPLILIIIILLFLMVASCVIYYYLIVPMLANKKTTQKIVNQTNQNQTTNLNKVNGVDNTEVVDQAQTTTPNNLVDQTATVPETKLTPKEIYMNLKNESDRATTADDYLKVWQKYSTEEQLKRLTEEKIRLDLLANNQATTSLVLLKKETQSISTAEEIKEEINGDQAKITIDKHNPKFQGIVSFKMINGQWKVDKEEWLNKDESNTNSTDNSSNLAALTPAKDTDGDGLTDEEEKLLGTDLNKVDSDGDGYSDLKELTNKYNPAGNGKLIDNPNLAYFNNKSAGYSFLYPIKWTKTNIENDASSINLRTGDNQLIQITTQQNTDKLNLDDWYKKYVTASFSNSQVVITGAGRSLRSIDGLTYYLTDSAETIIYVLYYNTSSNNILNYKNLFDMLVNNFSINQ